MAVGGEGFDIKHLGGFVFLIFPSVSPCLHPDTPTGVGLEDKGPPPSSLSLLQEWATEGVREDLLAWP